MYQVGVLDGKKTGQGWGSGSGRSATRCRPLLAVPLGQASSQETLQDNFVRAQQGLVE